VSALPGLDALLEDLEFFPDRADRIQYLISLSKEFVPSAREPDEEHRVPACESDAFVWMDTREGVLDPDFAVLNPQGVSAMAMAVILQKSLEGQPAAAARALPEDLPYTFFGRELSMGKSAGLMGMVQLAKALALRLES
jgi:sulfur transfer protein SufE